MQEDKPLIAGIIGAFSTLPGEACSRILLALNIGGYSIYQLDSLLITLNRVNDFIGLYLNFVIGATVGIAFYFSIQFLGKTHLVYKSVFVGILSSIFTEFLFSAIIEGHYVAVRPISDYYVHAISALIYGLVMGIAFNKYLFNQ